MVSGSEIYGQESEEQDRNVNVLCHIMIAEDQKSVKEIIYLYRNVRCRLYKYRFMRCRPYNTGLLRYRLCGATMPSVSF